MNCKACGYESDKFIEINGVYKTKETYGSRGDYYDVDVESNMEFMGNDSYVDLYACPKCGTVIIDDYLLDEED